MLLYKNMTFLSLLVNNLILMKSERSVSSIENQAPLYRPPKIAITLAKGEEASEKQVKRSHGSAKKIKLRDYLYVNQIKEQKRLLDKNNSSRQLTERSFPSFRQSQVQNPSRTSIIKHNRYKIENEEIFREVKKDINQDLALIVQTIQGLNEVLDKLTKNDISQNLMVELYQVRHKLKHNTLPQFRQYEQTILKYLGEGGSTLAEPKFNGKMSQSIQLIESQHQAKQEKQPYKANKVCLTKKKQVSHR